MQLSPARRALLAGGVVAALVLPGATPAQAAETGAVSGRLTTNAGTAAAEVLVQVYPADGYESVGQTHTDADGNYTVAGLPGGAYTVGYFPWTQPEQYHHRRAMMWDADPVTVTAGGTTTVDEQLFGTGTISGRIVDSAGRPVPNLLINANEVDTYNWAGWSTDEDGRFTITALPGRYRVSFSPIEDSYQTQYVPGSLDEEAATIFQVAADTAVEVNETVLPAGGLSGRFTTATGAPLVNAQVGINTANSYGGASAETDANGEFSVQVLQGTYKVGVIVGERQQFYRGKLTAEEANLVNVLGGRQTTIADSLLGTGSVTITAVDSVTGAPVANFCVDSRCSSGGTVTVTGLPQGRHDLYVYAPDKRYFSRELTRVRVEANGTTKLTVKMRPGAVITSTIVDSRTGAPVRDVCLDAYLAKQASLRDGYGECSDGNGRIEVGPLVGGTYKLFALPQEDVYGRQWVGAEGGTGDERQAAPVVATVGQSTTGPTVRLDRAGTVTGTVTDSTGKPLTSVDISVLTGHPGLGVQDASTDARGVYTIDRLGPYAWPLIFSGYPWASEWSGDATSRFTATPVTVTAGASATQDAQLDQGVALTGTFRTPDGTPFTDGYVIARSVDTGDIAGSGWITAGRFDIRLKGPQRIFFTYNAYLNEDQQVDGRYLVTQPDGTRKLERFTVPASGSMSVDLVVPIS
ncbi:carboxypeptidase-like regulatory domain-containing protein [Micromonospora sp. NPDC005298]|uniref:carboxypeptidase-like regulatory domain-containing protein n=1 Tax=Micromonospora sp. NPDC005298 TaxID=3156873 RepID=UPI0033BF23B7